MGTVELTGLEMIPSRAVGHALQYALVVKLLTSVRWKHSLCSGSTQIKDYGRVGVEQVIPGHSWGHAQTNSAYYLRPTILKTTRICQN